MNDLTTQPPKLSIAYSANAEIMIELAKMMALVAPTSMSAEQQELWMRSAADSLDGNGIRPDEVRNIAAEVKSSITHHQKIVPEICRLVSQKRARSSFATSEPSNKAWAIDREAEKRRKATHSQREVEEAYSWERQARTAAGLHVDPKPLPLSREELDNMPAHIRNMGLSAGFLEYRDGMFCETRP